MADDGSNATGPSGFSLSNIVSALSNIAQALGNLNKTVNKVFPQTIGVTTSGTGGSATALPAQPVGYLSVVNPVSGTTIKIPYYS